MRDRLEQLGCLAQLRRGLVACGLRIAVFAPLTSPGRVSGGAASGPADAERLAPLGYASQMAGETSDTDPVETREWLESVDAVVESDGRERMGYLLDQAIDHAQEFGVKVSAGLSTPYVNTIPVEEEPDVPGDPELERLATALVRWNAIAIVLQANAESSELGGHIASYQSAETLYEVGFNHFWRARSEEHGGDLVYMQGHSSPGIYSRAFLEGRLTEDQLHRFRQEVDGGGLSSYPHPWLMPEFWQFPTVSMGLGPLMAIYQARFMKYLAARDVVDPGDRKVWAFMGDGEMDEPESMGAISLAGREKLDNLVFVDQLQPAAPRRAGAREREDHPGARDELPRRRLERDQGDLGLGLGSAARGRHRAAGSTCRMEEAVDGEYQTFKSKDGAYVREHFFGKYPETRAMVEDWTRRADLGAPARRPRPAEGLCRIRRRRARRPASRP